MKNLLLLTALIAGAMGLAMFFNGMLIASFGLMGLGIKFAIPTALVLLYNALPEA